MMTSKLIAAAALAIGTTSAMAQTAAAPTTLPAGQAVAVRAPAVALLTWRALGINHAFTPDDVVAVGSQPEVKMDNLPAIFVGGAGDPGDVAGKVVLAVSGTADPAAWLKRGAAGVFLLLPENETVGAARARIVEGAAALDGVTTPVAYGAIGWSAWSKLVEGLGEDPRALVKMAGDAKTSKLNATVTGTVTTAITLPPA